LASADSVLAAEDADAEGEILHVLAMKTHTTFCIALLLISPVAKAAPTEDTLPDSSERANEARASYSAVRGKELMINGFRAPSIGLEYRTGAISLHAGAYPTIINDEGLRGVAGTTWFGKAGVTLWFLPVRMMNNERSSFYAGASYLTDFDKAGWGHGAQVEAGFRWVVYQGAFVRLGASVLYAPGRTCATDDCATFKIRPNPAIGLALPLD
jgi:hypothetical protein